MEGSQCSVQNKNKKPSHLLTFEYYSLFVALKILRQARKHTRDSHDFPIVHLYINTQHIKETCFIFLFML